MGATICIIAAVAGAIGILYLADRLLLKMEERGWIYYRKKQGHTDRIGEAMLRLQAILEPSKQYVIKEKEEKADGEHAIGEPPTSTEPGPSRHPAQDGGLNGSSHEPR